MAERETVLPPDVELVDVESIEICVVQNVSTVMLQVMRALGVTKGMLDANIEFYGQASSMLSITMLALIKASGGDYSLPMPPPEEFRTILSEIAEQNAYSIEYEETP